MPTFSILLLLILLASAANAEPYPWDLVKDGKFNKAYKAALGPKAKDPWLVKLDGPSEEGKKVKVGGKEYLFVHSCKQHACDTHNLVLFYAAESAEVFGKISENKNATYIGKPPADVRAELDTLYIKEFHR
ncbi:MAG TPA: Ivy family c-type lysozyme inhibitor [Candidatus Binatia bacterium]|jgi:Inhibitor of vertebrate lysozyme (Ivy)